MNTHCRSGAKQLERICLRMMPNTRFGVFMCVLLSLRFIETLHVGTRVPYTCCGGSIINSHRNPCVSRPEGGGGGGGLAGAVLPRFGLDTQLTHHLVHLAGQLHVSSHSIVRDFPFLQPKYCVGWAEVLFSLACVRARQIKQTRQRRFSGSSSPVGMAAERWQRCAAMSRGLQAIQLSLEIQHDTSAGRPLKQGSDTLTPYTSDHSYNCESGWLPSTGVCW